MAQGSARTASNFGAMPFAAAEVLAAARTILLEQGEVNATPGISYDAWLIKTVVPMWIVGWATLRVSSLAWWLGSRRRGAAWGWRLSGK